MIPPSYVRVLEAIMKLYRERRHITVRTIRDELGWRSNNYVHIAMHALRTAGLITFESGAGRGGTIVPRVRFIPAEKL